jgi:hypothetical protein
MLPTDRPPPPGAARGSIWNGEVGEPDALSMPEGKPGPKQPPPRLPAPRVSFAKTVDGQSVEPIPAEAKDLDAFRIGFLDPFGTMEYGVAEMLFQEILNIFHTDPGKPLEPATANLVLALMHSIGPKDEIEAMLALAGGQRMKVL